MGSPANPTRACMHARAGWHAAQVQGIADLVAVKVMDTKQFRNIRDVDQVRNELGVMQSLRHPHIIEMLDVVVEDSKLYIILECANGGDLHDHIRAQARPRCCA